MSLNARLMANGQFDVAFKRDIPLALLNALDWLSTVVVTDPWVDPDLLGNGDVHPGLDLYPSTSLFPSLSPMMTVATFAGVLIGLSARGMRGYGLAWWLGDTETGDPIEEELAFGGVPLSGVIPRLLPSALLPGTIHDTDDVFVGRVSAYQMPRPAIEYVSQVMRTEWRVNPDATFDAGTESQLFTETGLLVYPSESLYPDTDVFPQDVIPAAIVVRKGGSDHTLKTLQAVAMEHEADVEDYANRALVVGEDLVAASAETVSQYRDPHGNPVRITKVISDPDTDETNAAQRAVVELGNLAKTRNAVTLSVDDYHITNVSGSAPAAADVGTTVWVYDPDEGLFDAANPVSWRGQTVYPVALRVLAATRPVTADMGVFVRRVDGTFTDLSRFIEAESGPTTLEVGATRRTMTSLARTREAFRTRVALTPPVEAAAPDPGEDAVELPAALAWYRADDLALADGADVTAWADASGNGYDLAPDGTPDTDWAYPTLQTNELNGLPGVLFTARQIGVSPTSLDLIADLDVGFDHLTVLVVHTRLAANADSGFMPFYGYSEFFGDPDTGEFQLVSSGGMTSTYSRVVDETFADHEAFVEVADAADTPHWMVSTRSADGVAQALDGGTSEFDPTPLPNVIGAPTHIVVGSSDRSLSSNARDHDYLVHEIVAWADLTPEQIAALPAYVNSRWGL